MKIYDTKNKGIVLQVFDRSRFVFKMLNPDEQDTRKNIGGKYCYAEEGTGKFYFSEDHFCGLYRQWESTHKAPQDAKREAREAAEETVRHNKLPADFINLIQRFIYGVFCYCYLGTAVRGERDGEIVEKIATSMSTGKYY